MLPGVFRILCSHEYICLSPGICLNVALLLCGTKLSLDMPTGKNHLQAKHAVWHMAERMDAIRVSPDVHSSYGRACIHTGHIVLWPRLCRLHCNTVLKVGTAKAVAPCMTHVKPRSRTAFHLTAINLEFQDKQVLQPFSAGVSRQEVKHSQSIG